MALGNIGGSSQGSNRSAQPMQANPTNGGAADGLPDPIQSNQTASQVVLEQTPPPAPAMAPITSILAPQTTMEQVKNLIAQGNPEKAADIIAQLQQGGTLEVHQPEGASGGGASDGPTSFTVNPALLEGLIANAQPDSDVYAILSKFSSAIPSEASNPVCL